MADGRIDQTSHLRHHTPHGLRKMVSAAGGVAQNIFGVWRGDFAGRVRGGAQVDCGGGGVIGETPFRTAGFGDGRLA